MQLQEFFDRVLPATGERFYGATIDTANKFSEVRFTSRDKLEAFITNNKKDNVYYATGTFTDSRAADKVQQKKSYYVDIDCGPGKNYPTKQDAVADLQRFTAESGLMMPTIIVDSGNGLHLYWTLTEPVSGPIWRLTSLHLKKLCDDYKFNTDTVCTADAARILRAPTSTNFKDPTHPKVVRILRGDGTRDVTPDEFNIALNAQPSKLSGKLGLTVSGDDLSAGENWSRKYKADDFINECEVFKHSIATGGAGQAEPLWKDQLLVLAVAVDGGKYIHAIGDKHASYVAAETDYKFRQQVGKHVAPTTCLKFAEHAPELCAKCDWRGDVTSPLHITPTVLPVSNYNLHEYAVTASYPDQSGKPITATVCDFGVSDFHVTYNELGLAVQFIAALSKRKQSRRVQIDMTALFDKKTLVGTLSSQHIPFQEKHFHKFRDFMTSWMQKVQAAGEVSRTYPHLGWVNEDSERAKHKRGFVLSEKIVWDDGTETYNHIVDATIKDQFKPTGRAEIWQDIATEVTQQNEPAINAIIGTAFAAPLLHPVGIDGFFMSFSSAASGSGKTTTLRIAQAVWGDPSRGISMLNDTSMSVVKRLGFLCNLPAYWDEVRIKNNPAEFVNFLFQVTQGKERSRLTSTAKLQDMGTWATMLVIATNDSIVDHVKAETKSTDAGRARVFEVEMNELTQPNYNMSKRVNMLKANYGHAGEIYAKYIVTHYDDLVRDMLSVLDGLSKKLQPKPAERFWVAGAAAIIVGTHYAKKLGLVKTDLPQLTQWLTEQILKQRGSLDADFQTAPTHALDYVWAYCSEYRDQFIVCEHIPRNGLDKIPVRVLWIPERGQFLGTHAKEDGRVRISKAHFTQWLYKQKETPSQIISTLLKMHKAVMINARLVTGVPNAVTPRIRCLDIPLPNDVELSGDND